MHTQSEHWSHFKPLFLSLVLGQLEANGVKSGPVGFEKTYSILKTTILSLHIDNLVSQDFNEQTEKLV